MARWVVLSAVTACFSVREQNEQNDTNEHIYIYDQKVVEIEISD